MTPEPPMNRRLRFGLLAAFGLIVLAAAGFAIAMLSGNRPAIVSAYLSRAIGGPFRLVASDGRTVTERTYRGKWLLVFFGYTHCPDVCPTTLNTIAAALRQLGAEAAQVQPLFITVDPRRDTPQVLANYVKAFGSHIVGLTGTTEQIAAVAHEYKVYYSKEMTAKQLDYFVDHSAFIYVMDPNGKFVQVISNTASAGQIAARLRQLLERRA
jgi:protein SCO1/2